MKFELSDDQATIKRTANEFLAARYTSEERRRLADDAAGFTDRQWSELAELGWPGVAIGESRGGLGLGVLALAIIEEELGYALAPTPFLSTVSAALLLDACGDDDVVPTLADGSRRGAVALLDAASSNGGPPVRFVDGLLHASKIAVADAGTADVIVVAGGDGTHYLVDREATGVEVQPVEALDPTRKLFSVMFGGVRARELRSDADALERAYDTIDVAIAAESLGVAQRAMEMAVDYAKQRQQFGRPIGSNQAVSHRCAEMLLEVEGARALTYYAGWALDDAPASGALAASMAKAYAGEAGWRVPASAIQVHGGIGFTWEHDLHYFLKRGKANAQSTRDARWHYERVAELVEI
jgi:alkylation response protein AidB-like acyl-CoA dehydrogenase